MDSETDKIKHAGSGTSRVLPSAFDLFKPSMYGITKNINAYAWLAGLPILLVTISGVITRTVRTGSTGIWGVVGVLEVVGVVATLLFGPGLVLLQVATARGKTVDAMETFSHGLRYFWRYVLLGIMVVVLLTVSFVLLIVPFFLVLPRIVLAPYFMIDKDLTPIDALHASNDAYKKHGGIWGVLGVLVLLELPAIVPIIGQVVSAALEFLYLPAPAIRYEQILLVDAGKKPHTPIEAEALHAR